MPKLAGIGHITLTVTDLNQSSEFYNRVFDAKTVLEDEDQYGRFALSVGPSIMVGLRIHSSTPGKDAFDPTRVGLDHYGVHVESRLSWKTGRRGWTNAAPSTPGSLRAHSDFT